MDVLVVDDDPDIRMLVRRVLERLEIRVVEAGTGREALAHVAESTFDVAVLDLNLPDQSGLEVLAGFRRSVPRLHVIMLTGAGSERDRVLGLESGADDYVVKPFSARELGARILAVGRRLTAPPEDATIVLDGTTLASVSSAAARLLGADDASQLAGRDLFDFVAPESVAATMARFDTGKRGVDSRPELLSIRRVDGVALLVEIATEDVVWGGGPATQLTMWERTTDLARVRELAGDLGSAADDGVVVVNGAMEVQSFNAGAERLYGWREDEVVGRPVAEVVPLVAGDVDERALRESLFREGRWHGELLKRRRDGSTVRVRVSTTLLRDGAGAVVGLISVHRPIERVVGTQDDGALAREILAGLDRDEFVVHYQPVVQLGDGAALGVEALVRWRHPERGLLPPASFIGAAERTGAIVDIGQRVLERAAAQQVAWARAGHDLYVAVNLSGRQLADDALVDRIEDLLASTTMPASRLWLEVTETSVVDDVDRAADCLRRIAELGAHVSIDDFGTGWASLTYLREFPVHALKIDRVFVEGLGTGSRDTAIVRSMLSLGRQLGLAVVAEGIETVEQQARLLDLGCELGQGYYFGRPRPPHEVSV